MFHLSIKKAVNTPYAGMFQLFHEILFSACVNGQLKNRDWTLDWTPDWTGLDSGLDWTGMEWTLFWWIGKNSLGIYRLVYDVSHCYKIKKKCVPPY